MTRQVRVISPHGGAHHGIRHNGLPVHRLPIFSPDENGNPVLTDSYLPAVPPEGLALPPNEGGYITCPSLSRNPLAVGSVVDVPDDWEINEFHFEWVTPPPPADPSPAPAGPEEG